MLFSRSKNNVLQPIRRHFLRNNIYYSAVSFRLLLLLSLTGGSSVAQLQAWLGRAAMVQCYVKVSEKVISRYGRGKGKLACYRLTAGGYDFVNQCTAIIDELIKYELRNLPKKARETKVKRAKTTDVD